MSYIAKYSSLLDALYDATNNKKLTWSRDDYFVNAFSCSLGEGRIVISEGENDKGGPVIWISIYDDENNQLDSFNDETFRGETPSRSGFGGYWVYMQEIMHMARRNSTGADRVIDNIISQLAEKNKDES